MRREPRALRSFLSDARLDVGLSEEDVLVVDGWQLRAGRWEEKQGPRKSREVPANNEGDDSQWLEELQRFSSEHDPLRGLYHEAVPVVSQQLPESSSPEQFMRFVERLCGCKQVLLLQTNGAVVPFAPHLRPMRPALLFSRRVPLVSAVLFSAALDDKDPRDCPVRFAVCGLLRAPRLLIVHYLRFLAGASLEDVPAAWNAAPPLSEQLLPQMLWRSLQSNASRVAVIAEGNNTSYEQLEDLSLRVASRLPNKGVVMICCDSSLEYVVAVCACLFAGCCYVPVDPQYPKERIEYILKDR
jgi:hypothetical protein